MNTHTHREQPPWLLCLAGAVFALLIAGPLAAVVTMSNPAHSTDVLLSQAPPREYPPWPTRPFPDFEPAYHGDVGSVDLGDFERGWNGKVPIGEPGYDPWRPELRRW